MRYSHLKRGKLNVLEKMKLSGPGIKVELRNEEMPGRGQSIHGYIAVVVVVVSALLLLLLLLLLFLLLLL